MRGFSFVATLLLLSSCGNRSPQWTALTGNAQGSTFTIKYFDNLDRDLSGPIDSLFKVMDQSLSLWDSTSTVSRFNASDGLVSDDVHFRTVVALSQGIWSRTDQAFDPTVLPLVRAWGLGKEGRAELDTAAVLGIRDLVGMDKIRIENKPGADAHNFRKARIGVQFDPNGIAQGYTVDLIALFLQQHGIERYMVEVGGEVRALGLNEQNTVWVMQIDKPVDGDTHVQQTVVPLRDRSLATSGNYRKYIEIGGKRFGHTIDPRNGRPAMNALLSASVIADDCATADALGTALMVLGPDQSKEWLALHREVEAYLVLDDGSGGNVVWRTAGWPEP